MGRNYGVLLKCVRSYQIRFLAYVLSVVFVGSLSVSLQTMGYPTPVDVDGSLHVWPISAEAPTIFYEQEFADDALKSSISLLTNASAKLWTDVKQSSISLAPATTDIVPEITLYFDSSIDGQDMSAGYTIFDQVENGVPVHCSIHIAASAASLGSLNKTILHEMGHCLGLGHSLIPQSIMSYDLEVNAFALSIDDQAAVSRLYPLGQRNTRIAPGCSIGGVPEGGGNPLIWLAWLIGPLPLYYLRLALRRRASII